MMSDTYYTAKRMIKQHEGYRERPYKCTAGKHTIGWGHNMDDSSLPVVLVHGKISPNAAEVLLEQGISKAWEDARHLFPTFNILSPSHQAVLIDMAFNLGYPRLKRNARQPLGAPSKRPCCIPCSNHENRRRRMIDLAIKALTPIIEHVFPDKEKQAEAKLKLFAMETNGELERIKQQSHIIQAEINGESWLQRNWRPLLMLWFAGLVGAHWLGFTAPNITDPIVDKLLSIVQVGIGGYVVGRSAEKVAKVWRH